MHLALATAAAEVQVAQNGCAEGWKGRNNGRGGRNNAAEVHKVWKQVFTDWNGQASTLGYHLNKWIREHDVLEKYALDRGRMLVYTLSSGDQR